MKILNSKRVSSDDRGVIDVVCEDGPWERMNHIRTKKGFIRGDHYHQLNSELHYVLNGSLELYVRDLRTGEEATYQFIGGDCFIVEPHEFHTLRHLEDSEYMVLFSRRFDSENPDVHKDET